MGDDKRQAKPGDKDTNGKQPDMGPRDEAPLGTPGLERTSIRRSGKDTLRASAAGDRASPTRVIPRCVAAAPEADSSGTR